jgi:hypothetical protein
MRWFLVLASMTALAADPTPAFRYDSPNVRGEVYVEAMTEKAFRARVEELLGAPEITLGVVAAYESRRDLILAGPRQSDHCSYQSWNAVLAANQYADDRCPIVRDAIKLGKSTILRTNDNRCQTKTTLVQGADSPLFVTANGTKFEILSVRLSTPGSEPRQRLVSAEVFVRTDEVPTEQMARSITTAIKSITKAPYLTIVLRSDLWFVEDCGFPARYPFAVRSPQLSFENFLKTRSAVCDASVDWPIRCFDSSHTVLRPAK